MRLIGSAGVGKTWCAQEIITIMLNRLGRGKILVSAPTHKAVSILRTKVREHPRVEFATTHSALKLKRVINFKTGKVSFKPSYDSKYPPLQGIALLIVDESSMLNSELLDLIEEHSTKQGCKVVFLGDNKQLNPVGEEESPVFMSNYPEVELTEIIRQGAGNPIIELSRNLLLVNSGVENLIDPLIGYTYTFDKNKIIDALAKVNGTDEMKYLAWTNRDVDEMNRLVREKIYGVPTITEGMNEEGEIITKTIYSTPADVEVGETLVFNAPYGQLFHTNEEIKVDELEVKRHTFKYIETNMKSAGVFKMNEIVLKLYCINPSKVQLSIALPRGVLVIHEGSKEAYKALVKIMAANARQRVIGWQDYYHFIEQFADVKYNHALTVHKSQGSTFKQVILNVRDLAKNKTKKEWERLMYTGITRASDLLIFYNA